MIINIKIPAEKVKVDSNNTYTLYLRSVAATSEKILPNGYDIESIKFNSVDKLIKEHYFLPNRNGDRHFNIHNEYRKNKIIKGTVRNYIRYAYNMAGTTHRFD
jgi:hypothetical protein